MKDEKLVMRMSVTIDAEGIVIISFEHHKMVTRTEMIGFLTEGIDALKCSENINLEKVDVN